MSVLTSSLDHLDYAAPRSFTNLTMIPLVGRAPRVSAFITFDEAVATGRFRVTEASEGGHVPELQVQNDLETAVLLLDGEELVGAKQNRVVNLTILVPAQASLTIPVSCVEAGRWRYTSHTFGGSKHAQFREGRAHKMAQVSRSLAVASVAASNQGDVWARIGERAEALGSYSPTAAMHEIFEQRHQSIEEFVQALGAVEGQVGAAFAIDGRLAGVELFGDARTLSTLLPKIVSSYALDAVLARPIAHLPAFDPAAVGEWLDRVAAVEPRVHASVGLGEAVRWEAPGLTAAALVIDDIVVHFAGFPLDEAHDAGGCPPRAARQRRPM